MRVRILTYTENAKQISSTSLTNCSLLVDWPCFIVVLCFSMWFCYVPEKLHEWQKKHDSNTTLSLLIITFNEFLSFSNVFFLHGCSGQKWSHAHITSLFYYHTHCGFGRMMNEMKQYHKVYLSLLGICVQSTINNKEIHSEKHKISSTGKCDKI